MSWLWKAIWILVVALLEFLGCKYDWVKEEIDSKPKDSVI
jgi:hypothetical protein